MMLSGEIRSTYKQSPKCLTAMKAIIIILFVFLVGLSSTAMGQAIAKVEGRYFVNNNPREEVTIEHYQGKDFYVVVANQWEGFVQFNTPQKAMLGLWACFKPNRKAKKQALSGQYVGVIQPDGSITVTILPTDKETLAQVVQWIPVPKETR